MTGRVRERSLVRPMMPCWLQPYQADQHTTRRRSRRVPRRGPGVRPNRYPRVGAGHRAGIDRGPDTRPCDGRRHARYVRLCSRVAGDTIFSGRLRL